jgi:hypothetical protein
VADLLDKEIRPAANSVSQALKDFAEEADLPEEDVRMLTQVRFRGDQPSSKEDWRYLYESIKRSIVRGS